MLGNSLHHWLNRRLKGDQESQAASLKGPHRLLYLVLIGITWKPTITPDSKCPLTFLHDQSLSLPIITYLPGFLSKAVSVHPVIWTVIWTGVLETFIPTSSQCSSAWVIGYNDIVSKIWFWTYRFRYISTASAFFQNTSLNLTQSNRILVFFMSHCPASTVFSMQNPDLFCLMCFISSPSLLNTIQQVSIVLRIKQCCSQISKIFLA